MSIGIVCPSLIICGWNPPIRLDDLWGSESSSGYVKYDEGPDDLYAKFENAVAAFVRTKILVLADL